MLRQTTEIIIISIHALREEGDLYSMIQSLPIVYFNPRPPRGGRPDRYFLYMRRTVFQSTPSARRATERRRRVMARSTISIHALREEGDVAVCDLRVVHLTISIHALREEGDPHHRGQRPREAISIHALREESDVLLFQQILLQGYFNPRPPRGGRHRQSCRVCITTLFQSTPSARRATPCGLVSVVPLVYFNPRPPRGGRPTKHISTKCPT